MDMEPTANVAANRVVCPECGKVRLETPPGTKVLPTLGMAKKASGAAGQCGCGKHRPEMVATDHASPSSAHIEHDAEHS